MEQNKMKWIKWNEMVEMVYNEIKWHKIELKWNKLH